eukprot:6175593-Pleurochrysis_carterae.AAC.2
MKKLGEQTYEGSTRKRQEPAARRTAMEQKENGVANQSALDLSSDSIQSLLSAVSPVKCSFLLGFQASARAGGAPEETERRRGSRDRRNEHATLGYLNAHRASSSSGGTKPTSVQGAWRLVEGKAGGQKQAGRGGMNAAKCGAEKLSEACWIRWQRDSALAAAEAEVGEF